MAVIVRLRTAVRKTVPHREEPARPVADVARRMLDTHPRDFIVDRDQLVRCIEACADCAQACTQCADACLSEDDAYLRRSR